MQIDVEDDHLECVDFQAVDTEPEADRMRKEGTEVLSSARWPGVGTVELMVCREVDEKHRAEGAAGFEGRSVPTNLAAGSACRAPVSPEPVSLN